MQDLCGFPGICFTAVQCRTACWGFSLIRLFFPCPVGNKDIFPPDQNVFESFFPQKMDVQAHSGAFTGKKEKNRQNSTVFFAVQDTYIKGQCRFCLFFPLKYILKFFSARCLPSAERLLFLCFGFHVLPVSCSAKLFSPPEDHSGTYQHQCNREHL